MSLLTLLLLVTGLALLVGGAEVLVRGATRLSLSLGISPLIIGLTVVAYGTSSPEIAVNLQAGFSGESDLALGNIIGSNIANILLVLGVAAMVAPLIVQNQLVRFDVPIMISVSILLLLVSLDGRITRLESALLAVGAVIYTGSVLVMGKRGSGSPVPVDDIPEADLIVIRRNKRNNLRHVAYIAAGLALLVLGARLLVDSAVEIATTLGVSQMVIGLTIVAVGTAAPEVATTVTAVLKGERDLAVGTIIGSNIFNILFVLGITGLVTPSDMPVPDAAINFDMLVMIAVAVACLPIFFTGGEISRWEGALFVAYFFAYIGYLILQSQEHDALPAFSQVMLVFVIPITALTLILLVLRSWRRQREVRSSAQSRG